MKIFTFLFVVFFVFFSGASAQYLTPDVDRVSELVHKKQEEIKKRLIKDLVRDRVKTSNSLTYNTFNNLLDILLEEKNKKVLANDIIKELTRYSIVMGVSEAFNRQYRDSLNNIIGVKKFRDKSNSTNLEQSIQGSLFKGKLYSDMGYNPVTKREDKEITKNKIVDEISEETINKKEIAIYTNYIIDRIHFYILESADNNLLIDGLGDLFNSDYRSTLDTISMKSETVDEKRVKYNKLQIDLVIRKYISNLVNDIYTISSLKGDLAEIYNIAKELKPGFNDINSIADLKKLLTDNKLDELGNKSKNIFDNINTINILKEYTITISKFIKKLEKKSKLKQIYEFLNKDIKILKNISDLNDFLNSSKKIDSYLANIFNKELNFLLQGKNKFKTLFTVNDLVNNSFISFDKVAIDSIIKKANYNNIDMSITTIDTFLNKLKSESNSEWYKKISQLNNFDSEILPKDFHNYLNFLNTKTINTLINIGNELEPYQYKYDIINKIIESDSINSYLKTSINYIIKYTDIDRNDSTKIAIKKLIEKGFIIKQPLIKEFYSFYNSIKELKIKFQKIETVGDFITILNDSSIVNSLTYLNSIDSLLKNNTQEYEKLIPVEGFLKMLSSDKFKQYSKLGIEVSNLITTIDTLSKSNNLYSIKDYYRLFTEKEFVYSLLSIFNNSINTFSEGLLENKVLADVGEIITRYIVPSDTGTTQSFYGYKIDVEAIILSLGEKYINLNLVSIENCYFGYEIFFDIGMNFNIKATKDMRSIIDSKSNTGSLSYVAEKLGVKMILYDFEYTWAQEVGEWYDYRGYKYRWLADKGSPTVSNLHLLLYHSGLIYHIVDLSSMENYQYSQVGVGFGIEWFNSLSTNFGYVLPYGKDINAFSHGYFNLGLDIPILEYLGD